MRNVRTLGLLGTGVIGGGWAARALHFGINVVAADVKPEMEDWIRGAVANAEPALSRLTFAPLPPKGTLSFTTDPRVMVGLWLWAAVNNVSRGRLLARLCKRDLTFKWMCGDLSMNYHSLNALSVVEWVVLGIRRRWTSCSRRCWAS